MTILAINTASSRSAIALLEKITSEKTIPGDNSSESAAPAEAPTILAESSWPAENREAELLMPGVAELLKGAGKTFQDLNQILVIKGPGSFTGLRIGITVANTIAYLTHAELFGLTTFEYLHSAAKNLPVLLYAGSGGVYLSLNTEQTPELINLPDLPAALQKHNITELTGDISPDQKSTLKSTYSQLIFHEPTQTFGQIIAKILSIKTLKPVKIVEPVYLKEPSITQIKKP